jgi:hypothetical protein
MAARHRNLTKISCAGMLELTFTTGAARKSEISHDPDSRSIRYNAASQI